MATEEGIITKIDATTAWAKTTRSSSCASCSSRDSCNVMEEGGKEMIVEARNPAGAKVGDRVVLSFETSSLLKALFLLYVFPIICMIAGAVAGHKLAAIYNYNDSVISAISGFLFFFLAIIVIRLTSDKLAEKDAYKPKIIRILSKSK
ncbi:MAG: SoxR reducing system RseC family protein [Desulfosarcina sp.]|nr:SoxR reducing system RseC family protein [Desulfobacterales bacterium]